MLWSLFAHILDMACVWERYSSAEVLMAKLRYAINNCKAIDTDNYARTTLPAT